MKNLALTLCVAAIATMGLSACESLSNGASSGGSYAYGDRTFRSGQTK